MVCGGVFFQVQGKGGLGLINLEFSVALQAFCDAQGGKEFRIKITGGKFEAALIIRGENLVIAAHLPDRSQHAIASVVVSGDRQRPSFEVLKILLEQLRGCLSGTMRIVALINKLSDG